MSHAGFNDFGQFDFPDELLKVKQVCRYLNVGATKPTEVMNVIIYRYLAFHDPCGGT
jgi:hypothetical protein